MEGSVVLRRKLSRFEIKEVHGLDKPDKKLGGEGSYGAVYEVTVNRQPCYAKQLHSVLLAPDIRPEERQGIYERFLKECLILSELNHDSIVRFVGVNFGSSREREFDVSLIMEKLDTDLSKYLRDHPNVPLCQKLTILLDVSEGLLYLHSRQPQAIIHRDLTTSNILLTAELQAKIADFGVSRALNMSPNRPATQTTCPGTLAYMPPEALQHQPVYGKALDIFSFGEVCLCTIHQKFAKVFDVTNEPDFLNAHRHGEVEILKRKRWLDAVPFDHCLRDVLISCLQDKPDRRPTTQQLYDSLTKICMKKLRAESGLLRIHDMEKVAKLADATRSFQLEKSRVDEISTLKEALRKKNIEIANLEIRIYELDKVALTMGQVMDHSRYQSKSLMEVKQKLDATQDNYAEAMVAKRDLEKNLQEALESVDTLTLENKAFTEERVVLKKGITKLQDQLQIAKTEAELYKEDFESERRDREKAHNLKEDMRLACDEKVHAMAVEIETLHLAHEETILLMTRKLEGVSNEKDRIRQTRELHDTRSSSAKQQIELKDKEIHELQHHLFEARQKAITAQEEVQAKTAQVKQYKKKDDQREEKLQTLEKRNVGLAHDMERVRQELVKAKQEYASMLKEEKSSHSKAMEQVRQELDKLKKKTEHLTKSKKLSKSDAHEELVRTQQDIESLREDNTRLNASLQQVEEQYARMKKSHQELKKKKNSTVPLASPSEQQRLPSPLTKSNTGPTPTTLVETNAAESPGNSGSTQPNSPFPPPSSQRPDEPFFTRRDLHPDETNIGVNQATMKKSTVEDRRPQTLSGVATPTDGYQSLPSDMDRSAPQHIEADGMCATFQHSDELNVSVIAGSPPIAKQNLRPGALVEPAGCHAQGSASFRDHNYRQGNQVQGYNQDDQQMHQPPSQWNSPQARYGDAQAQWPEQGQYYQHDYQQDQRGYQQQPPQPQWQGQHYQEPGAEHRPHNSQWEYTQQGGEPQQQYWPEERSQQPQPQQYNPTHQPQHRHLNDYPLADNQIHSHRPAYFPGNDLVHDPSSAHAHSPDSRFGVELQSPSSRGTPEKPVPRPRQLNPHQSSRRPEGSTPTPDPPSPENPNSTRLLVEQNALHDNIDEEISEAMAKVSEVTKNEKERAGAPLDPNLVCPMCMKQYRIGEIQLFRVHVNKCDGAKH